MRIRTSRCASAAGTYAEVSIGFERIEDLDAAQPRPASMQEHARALELACRGAAQVLASRSIEPPTQPQEPLRESTVRLLRRLPRAHG